MTPILPKVGDRVQITKQAVGGDEHFLGAIGTVTEIGKNLVRCADWTGHAHSTNDFYWNTDNVTKIILKEKTMANALTLVKATIDPETRYARANGIEEINGTLTGEGDNVVTQWVYNKNKTQIIADLKAAEKAVNVARKADEAELEAD